jgi:hypothetical protein
MADQKIDINVNLDTTPILYTDNLSMSVNEDGVVIDVLQRVSNTNTLRIVSRIGMSKDHAKKFLVEFGRLLALTEGKKETGSKN